MATLDFLVNSLISGTQNAPDSARLLDGSFIVVWDSGSSGDENVFFQRYAPDGLRDGAEKRANSASPGGQYEAAVAALADGGFVITYTSDTGDPDSADDETDGVFAQRFDRFGGKVGDEILVNETAEGAQQEPDVVGLPDGGFVTFWESGAQDGDGKGLYMQRFDIFGRRVGTETLVNTTTAGAQQDVRAAALTDGGFAVVWEGDGSGKDIFLQFYNASGAATGGEQLVNDAAATDQANPHIAALADGGFVVTWYDNESDGGIQARLYDATGTQVGSQIEVSAADATAQPISPTVDATSDGFVVVWKEYLSTGFRALYARRYDDAGASLADARLIGIARAQDTSEAPSVLGLDDGGFAAIWTSPAAGDPDIYGMIEDQGTAFRDIAFLQVEGEFSGGGGDDFLQGSSGDDFLYGGDGADVLSGEDGDDLLDAGELGQAVADLLYGGAGDDLLIGSQGADQMFGGDDADVLKGKDGGDRIEGGADGDVLLGGGGADDIYGGNGSDNLFGGGGDDFIAGGANKDIIRGQAGDDFIIGGAAADRIFGGDGDDVIDGGTEKDRLAGGLGDDVLTGGGGADRFLFITPDPGDEAQDWGDDVIRDFADGSDLLDFADSGVTGIGDLTILDNGDDAVISFGEASIIVIGASGDIDAADMLF